MTGKLNIVKYCIAAACFVLAPLSAQATLISYDIMGTVTSAPESPGSFAPDTDYNFETLPSAFAGTFMADDTLEGEISALSLIIGGVDVAAFGMDFSNFDPNTMALTLSLCCGVSENVGIIFGTIEGFDEGLPLNPSNRVAAIQNSIDGPVSDDFFNFDQNWEGTFSVAKATSSVSEPGILALMVFGLAGLGLRRKKQA